MSQENGTSTSERPPTIVLFDGYNLYHALEKSKPRKSHHDRDKFRYRKYKWLDLHKLANRYAEQFEGKLEKTFYFTAFNEELEKFGPEEAEKKERHKLFIAAQEPGKIKVIEGKIRPRQRPFEEGRKIVWKWVPQEKQTDTNMAIVLLETAARKLATRAIIVSADADILPTFESIRRINKEFEVGVVIPINKPFDGQLKRKFFHIMTEEDLENCQLDDPVVRDDGTEFCCPETWKNGYAHKK